MRYDVHIFAVVRVKVAHVKARNHAHAIRVAERELDLYELFDSRSVIGQAPKDGASETQYAEELSGSGAYLVDRCGDSLYLHSKSFDQQRKRIP